MPVTVFAFLTVVRMVPNRNESQTHKRMTHQLDSRRIPSFLLGSLSVAFLHFAIHLRRPRRRLNRPFSVVTTFRWRREHLRFVFEENETHRRNRDIPVSLPIISLCSFAVTLFMVFSRVSAFFDTCGFLMLRLVEGFAVLTIAQS